LATKEQAGRPRVDDAIKVGLYLASDTYSLADVAVIPYILRLELLRLSPIWDGRRNVAALVGAGTPEILDRHRRSSNG
jgi:glutathione S-transferase